jgi:hypothetical protein
MNKNDFLTKIILLIGTSTVATTYTLPFENNNQTFLPSSNYMSVKTFQGNNEFKHYLKHELIEEQTSDEPIPIPVIKSLRFKFSKPQKLEFSN